MSVSAFESVLLVFSLFIILLVEKIFVLVGF